MTVGVETLNTPSSSKELTVDSVQTSIWTISKQTTTTIERLVVGRERIKRGWCKGRNHRGSEEGQILSYCTLGAILGENDILDQTTRRAGVALLDVIDNIYGKLVYYDIQAFNDDPKRKKADVINVFNLAIQSIQRSG